MPKINLIRFLLLIILPTYSINSETNQDMMSPAYLLTVIDKLERGENVIFTKFGDGEYNCMVGDSIVPQNCDGDRYHPWLTARLKESFLNLLTKKNTYLGRWGTELVDSFLGELASEKELDIPYCCYHLVMNDDAFFNHDYMHKFVQFIVNTDRKKIIVANAQNSRLKNFFKANTYITIPSRCWSYEYDKWLGRVESELEENAIVLISAGLCSKVLIDELTNRHNVTCIDLGSSFDLLARKQKSRGWSHSYEDEIQYYKDFIPQNWNPAPGPFSGQNEARLARIRAARGDHTLFSRNYVIVHQDNDGVVSTYILGK